MSQPRLAALGADACLVEAIDRDAVLATLESITSHPSIVRVPSADDEETFRFIIRETLGPATASLPVVVVSSRPVSEADRRRLGPRAALPNAELSRDRLLRVIRDARAPDATRENVGTAS